MSCYYKSLVGDNINIIYWRPRDYMEICTEMNVKRTRNVLIMT